MHLALLCNFSSISMIIIMQNQELLLLQILKFPVIIIKFLARLLSILTYLPNYAILFLIDSVLFRESLQSTRLVYVLTWLPKVILLSTAISLFIGEFYIIFQVMQLHEHGLMIQIVGMILTIVGLIILMRKGYLSLLKKYNLTKLKSPLEHAELGILYIIDLFGVVLWLVNAALILNIGRSWNYDYDPAKKYRFIKHTFNLIRQSMITYIEFFYVKIFFNIFPWRFSLQVDTYQKQKEEKNVLNCLVLLTLIYLTTILDLIIVALFAVPCLLHHKRKDYLKSMKQSHEKYKITLKHLWFVLLNTIQLLLILICTIFCWSNGGKSLKTWVEFSKVDELFGSQFWALVVQALLKIPYLIATCLIMISVYKFKRRNLLIKKLEAKCEQNKQKEGNNDRMWITFTCLGQLIVDTPFIILIILATVLKPWNIWWLKEILNQEFEIHHALIVQYLLKSMSQIAIIPCAFITSVLISLYEFKRLSGLFQQAGEEVYEEFKITSINMNAAPDLQKKKQFILKGKSQVGRYLYKTCICLKEDIPHLPLLCLAQMTFLNLYFPEVKPKTTPDLYIMLQRSYYYSTARKSIRYQQYRQMFQRIKASGGLTNIKEQYRFWKFAYKSQRLILLQKMLSFVLPKKSVERILKRIEMGTQLSQISNFYWYHNELTKAMAVRLVFLIIQAILTLIGILILFPLTLWRIPTFIKLFAYHKNRKFFFPILKRIYIQMFRDVLTLPIKIITFFLAPRAYILYVLKTAFKYGPAGVQTFQIYQKCKYNYLITYILHASWVLQLLQFQILFISIFWIRIRNLKMRLRTMGFSIFNVFTELIYSKIDVPSIDVMITETNEDRYTLLIQIYTLVTTVYHESLEDLPYLLLMIFVFMTMPWRINYLIQTVKDMRSDSTQRKSFFKLLRNIFKDYACIFLNILLLISGFKTKKALFLIRRNYRLNFFIGFLEYSYFQQLKNQMRSLGVIYKNVFFLIVAILFGWTRTGQIVNELELYQKKKRQEKQSAESNKKLYENTVKSGKQLQTLHKMGYYNYLTVCSFLNVSEIIKLRQVDQFNYMMTQRQEIWFVKWQYIYSKISNEISQSFEIKCKKAYIKMKNQNAGEIVTYEDIIMKYFYKNVFEQNVDLAVYLREKIPIKYYDMIFKNYTYQVHQGYGPQNELPQQQNQDQEFLRLTNQVRRPKVYLNQNQAFFHLFYVRSNETVVQKIHSFFRQDSHRRLKQLLLLTAICGILSAYISSIWLLRDIIFSIDSLIGIKIIIGIHFHSFMYLLFVRCGYLRPFWVSIIPFDLYYDVIRFKNYIVYQTKNKIIIPTKNLLIKCWQIIADIGVKVMTKLTEKGDQLYQKMAALGLKIKRGGQRVKDFTVKYSILAYQRVVKPLYVSIADKIRKLKDLIVHIFTVVITSIKSVLLFIGRLITSFYEAIRGLLRHINNLYFFILKSCMEYLLKFGLIGNLIFTLLGLLIMTLPSLIWFTLYRERWYLIVSTIHTMVLIVAGYKHLNKIKDGKRDQRKQS